MSAIGSLSLASHGGIQFPYTELRVALSQRHHVHIYVHTPGGAIEKLGRNLYQWEFTIPAHDTLRPPFQNFYSKDLPRLWALWESGATAPLVVPNAGTFNAFAPNAKRTIRGPVASGEPVEVSLLEDQAELFAFSALFTPSVDAIPLQHRTFVRQAQGIVEPKLIDRLLALVDELLLVANLAETYAFNLLGKLESLYGLCETLRRVPALGQADNFAAFDLLLSFQATIVALLSDTSRRARPVLTDITPARMTPAQISAWKYKDTSRVPELYALNDWPDPLSVPRGSLVRYYAV